MKRGRKAGVSTGPTKGSLNHTLSQFDYTEERFIEVFTIDNGTALQRRIAAKTRYPDAMKKFRFETGIFTAISAQNPADIRYLLRIKRIN